MPVVGTAGHVDHGKSTLVQALCGRDPDRWREEKERGLTIDLGFAWTEIGNDEVSFVDVPGHERYSKNMLAGIEAIDVALFVVAADEGWMPQSEEHLAVLDLLGVERGVVALTKVDRADDDLVELAELEISERFQGTSLEGAPIVRVDSVSGAGLDRVREALGDQLVSIRDPNLDRPRLWVDRAFSVVGAGTVVTGTLLGGPVEMDMRLQVYPGRREVRVRGIQSHERNHDRVEPGRRTALNLVGIDVEDLSRGAMLGGPKEWNETPRIAVEFRTARYVPDLPARGAYHLHVGSGAWQARVRAIDEAVAIVDLEAPLPLAMGDRFILRDTGRRLVVAGGRVIDPAPRSARRLRSAAAPLRAAVSTSLDTRAAALLAARGRDTLENLRLDSAGGRPEDAVVAGRWAVSSAEVASLGKKLATVVADFHRDHPLRPGIGPSEASTRIGVDADVVSVLVSRDDTLASDGAHIRLASFTGVRSDRQQEDWARARGRLESAGATGVPRAEELELDAELLANLVREGELIRVSDDFVYLPDQVEDLVSVIRSMESPFTVSEFRDRSGLSRKYAVPFLEWADRNGVTVRLGDTRRVR